jgi:hypothetical protein
MLFIFTKRNCLCSKLYARVCASLLCLCYVAMYVWDKHNDSIISINIVMMDKRVIVEHILYLFLN